MLNNNLILFKNNIIKIKKQKYSLNMNFNKIILKSNSYLYLDIC